jgi:hypothetical protein
MSELRQVRTGAVTVLVATELLGELGDWSQPVRVRVDETPGTGTGYEMTFQTVDREAVQQLDQVRAAFQRWSGGPDDEFEQTMRALLDAPAERDRRMGVED